MMIGKSQGWTVRVSKCNAPPVRRLSFRAVVSSSNKELQEETAALPSHKSSRNKQFPPCFCSSMRSLIVASLIALQVCLGQGPSVASGISNPLVAAPEASETARVSQSQGQSLSQHGGMSRKRYWTIMDQGTPDEKKAANTALLDFAVGTINTMYYDNSAGARFDPHDFYWTWKNWLKQSGKQLEDRQGAVQGLQWLTSQLHDPYSVYLTREELKNELTKANDGFLGLGAMVQPPSKVVSGSSPIPVALTLPVALSQERSIMSSPIISSISSTKQKQLLSTSSVLSLPVITAVAPDSPAERAGLTVGDRIVAVGTDCFLGHTEQYVNHRLEKHYQAENYLGRSDLTVAKPVFSILTTASTSGTAVVNDLDESTMTRDVVVAYRPTRVRLPTIATDETALSFLRNQDNGGVAGGDSIVHYKLLRPDSSIFDRAIAQELQHSGSEDIARTASRHSGLGPVGYIRLTRFSRASTAGYVRAVQALETAGATSYIIDLRNCYGGIIQEAMLTASTLLRDPHAVLCYTMNSRGGFTPHDVEEYVVDSRYPGYLLSKETRNVVKAQVKREDPEFFDEDGIMWVPPSSYASLHEQTSRRGIHRASYPMQVESAASSSGTGIPLNVGRMWNSNSFDQYAMHRRQLLAQKNLVLLVNEGTASSAEVFASALHDNGRIVALVGTRTFSKGLIQHTFPMPDGGGLRLTVAEYLTPGLKHVTNVGLAQFDPITGERTGGGIQPEILCQSKQGIPANIGADLCVGMALDALGESDSMTREGIESSPVPMPMTARIGGAGDGSQVRRAVTVGVARDDF